MSDVITAIWAAAFNRGYDLALAPPRRPGFDSGARDHSAEATHVPGARARVRPPTVINGLDSTELVARIRRGEASTLTAVYAQFYEPLWRFAAALTGSGDDAQEITQDVFVSLWERRAALEIRGDIESYLYSAIRYSARHVIRRRKFRDGLNRVFASADDIVPGLGSAPQTPDQLLAGDDLATAVSAALDTLPERSKAALFLRWEQGHTFQEIGDILGISAPAVHKLVARAQQRVMPLLERFRQSPTDSE